MNLNILPAKEETIRSVATHIVSLAQKSISDKGFFTFVLSGGQTPEALYELLAKPPFSKEINWHKVFFFWGDERFVPADDKESNYNMAMATLLTPLQIPPGQIFPIDTSVEINKAAMLYQQKLKDFFGGNKISFDLILLGMGDNLHVASLFPHDVILNDTEPAIKAVSTDDKNPFRITMNAPMINDAKAIFFLVSGKQKALAVRQAFNGVVDTNSFPVQLISKRHTYWFIDNDAAAYL